MSVLQLFSPMPHESCCYKFHRPEIPSYTKFRKNKHKRPHGITNPFTSSLGPTTPGAVPSLFHEHQHNVITMKGWASSRNGQFMILRCVIPVVCHINQTIRCMRISSNTIMYKVVYYLLYVKHNYMFRP